MNPTQNNPLTAEEMEERLDEHVDAVLSSRRTAAQPARQLASLGFEQQGFVLHWVEAIAKSNAEMAYQFAAHAGKAMDRMDTQGVEAWVIQAMDAFDKKGLSAGIAQLHKVEEYAEQQRERATGLALEEVSGVLENFIHGLNGRRLNLVADEALFTDTETLFVPALINRLASHEDNFRLYKAMVVHLWAQTWYGTWRIDLQDLTHTLRLKDKAIALFHALETRRLDACIQRDLPGVHREMGKLRKGLDSEPLPTHWVSLVTQLQTPSASAKDSWGLVLRLLDGPVPAPCCYQGRLFPQRVQEVIETRKSNDMAAFRIALAQLRDDLDDPSSQSESSTETTPSPSPSPLKLKRVPANDLPQEFSYQLEFGDRPVAPPDEIRGIMASILQDLGEIPQDYLVPAGPGAYKGNASTEEIDPNDVWKGTYHEQGAILHNEWDHSRQHYRKNWCVLRERDVHPQYNEFVPDTLNKYSGLAKSLRRTFEALRGEDKLLKRQPWGDDIDIDALVQAYAEVKSGREMSNRVFTKRHKEERNIAVMFMVDMSGSTKGWINDAERESLVLLCEALETLGDRYAIYGFSGMTRKRCELFRIKRFDEPYDAQVRARISGILPQDYTRMGVAIRHLSRLLNEVETRTKLLVTLSDGKPDDYTDYRGEYGIEDTRQALLEARRDGIHPFCITIDDEAGDYLPHMYGAVNYIVINDVKKLPLKVSDIYRRLTT
ncbi:MAG: VWA domain-containing protein [Pseudomonadota bacterium]